MADAPVKDPPPRSTRTPPPPSPSTSTSKPNARTTPARKAATPRQSPSPSKEKAQRRGGNGTPRRSSVGAATSIPAAIPAQNTSTGTSEGLANLQSLISELSAASPSNPTISTSPARSRSRNKNPNVDGTASPVAPNLTLPLPTSSLNANALGFNSSLGVIHDLRNEGLITPTATSFDLMTGMPRQPHGSALGNQQSPPRAFAFPQTPVSQLLLLQQQQQQQLQMQQMQQMQAQNMGFVDPSLAMPLATPPRFPAGPPPTQDETNGLMAEQFAIQQQFENLRLQQENLLARFSDMQSSPEVSTATPRHAQQQSASPGHRRLSSQQPQGGSFGGQGGMGNFSTGGVSFAGAVAANPTATGLPRGHGRRHSVTTNSPQSSASPALSAASPMYNQAPPPQMSGSASYGSLSGAFQFPNGPGGNQSSGEFGGDAGLTTVGGPPSSAGRRYGHSRNESQGGSMGGWSMCQSPFFVRSTPR